MPPAWSIARKAHPVRSACRQSLLQFEEKEGKGYVYQAGYMMQSASATGRARPYVDADGRQGIALNGMTRRRQYSAHAGECSACHVTQHLQQSKHAHVSEVRGRVCPLETNTLPVPD
jgi:hypothetical protein